MGFYQRLDPLPQSQIAAAGFVQVRQAFGAAFSRAVANTASTRFGSGCMARLQKVQGFSGSQDNASLVAATPHPARKIQVEPLSSAVLR